MLLLLDAGCDVVVNALDGELGEGDCLVTSGGTSKRLRHVLHVAFVQYGAGGIGLVSTPVRITLATEAALESAA